MRAKGNTGKGGIRNIRKKKASSQKYHKKHKKEIAARDKRRRDEHKDEIHEYNKQMYLKNRYKRLSRQKLYNKEHKKEIAERYKRYSKEHKEERLKYFKERYARIKQGGAAIIASSSTLLALPAAIAGVQAIGQSNSMPPLSTPSVIKPIPYRPSQTTHQARQTPPVRTETMRLLGF